MKKGIIILAIAVGLMLLFDEVKADTLNTFNTGGWAGWPDSTAFGSQYSEARIDNPTYVNSIFNPSNTLSNITGINKVQINGYFYYLDLDKDYQMSCTQYDTNTYGCLEWNVYNGNEKQFNFQLWTNTRTTQCQMEFNNLNSSFTTEGGRYVFWTATCNASALNNIQLLIEYTNEDWGNDHHPKIGINKYVKYWTSDSSTIIDNQNQNTQQILEQNATYSDTPSVDTTNETQELNDYEQAEQNLINSLDLNMSVMDGITINPNASAYIWQIIDRLRQINPAIILLMTSILGMGIIKMVLNR